MSERRAWQPPVSPNLFEGELYETPALARDAIEGYSFGVMALPFMSFVRRNRSRETAKAALATVPQRFESFSTDRFTGKSGRASIYISRKIANETQHVAREIRSTLAPATREGTYRALGLGGWHVTIAKAPIDMEGMSPEEFAESVKWKLETRASRLLRPVGNVAIVGARVCGNVSGRHGSSRFIGLTPHMGSGLLEDMRTVGLLLNPLADVTAKDWSNIPHVSIAKAENGLFDLNQDDQLSLEGSICSAVETQAMSLRPLTLTAACVEISDPR